MDNYQNQKNSLNDIRSKLYLLCTDTFMKYKTPLGPWFQVRYFNFTININF